MSAPNEITIRKDDIILTITRQTELSTCVGLSINGKSSTMSFNDLIRLKLVVDELERHLKKASEAEVEEENNK